MFLNSLIFMCQENSCTSKPQLPKPFVTLILGLKYPEKITQSSLIIASSLSPTQSYRTGKKTPKEESWCSDLGTRYQAARCRERHWIWLQANWLKNALCWAQTYCSALRAPLLTPKLTIRKLLSTPLSSGQLRRGKWRPRRDSSSLVWHRVPCFRSNLVPSRLTSVDFPVHPTTLSIQYN